MCLIYVSVCDPVFKESPPQLELKLTSDSRLDSGYCAGRLVKSALTWLQLPQTFLYRNRIHCSSQQSSGRSSIRSQMQCSSPDLQIWRLEGQEEPTTSGGRAGFETNSVCLPDSNRIGRAAVAASAPRSVCATSFKCKWALRIRRVCSLQLTAHSSPRCNLCELAMRTSFD